MTTCYKYYKSHHSKDFPIISVTLSKDKSIIVTGSMDRSVHVWDVHNPSKEKLCFIADGDFVRSIAISSDNRFAVVGSNYKSFSTWNLQTGGRIRWFKNHVRPVFHVALSSDDDLIASGSNDGKFILWSAKSGVWLMQYYDKIPISQLRFTSDDKGLLYATPSGVSFLPTTGEFSGKRFPFDIQRWRMQTATISPDAKKLAFYDPRQSLVLLSDIQTGSILKEFYIRSRDGKFIELNAILFSPNGKWLVCGMRRNDVIIFDIETGQQLRRFHIKCNFGFFKIDYGSKFCGDELPKIQLVDENCVIFSYNSDLLLIPGSSVYYDIDNTVILALLKCNLPPYVVLDITEYVILFANDGKRIEVESEFAHCTKIKKIARLQKIFNNSTRAISLK